MPIIPLSGSAVARGALVPIASGVVTNTTTQSFDFNNIPQIYQDLRLVINMRIAIPSTIVSEAQFLYYNVNQFGFGDTNYSQQDMYSNSASVLAQDQSNPARIRAMQSSLGQQTIPNTFGTAIYDILNYANPNVFKQTLIQCVGDRTGSGFVYESANLWRRTAALTQISIFTESGGVAYLEIGTSATLYGVRSINQ
jgi:hypothetical protein